MIKYKLNKAKPYIFCAIALYIMVCMSSCKTVDSYYVIQGKDISYRVYEDDCLRYEQDDYHTTVCWDSQYNSEEIIQQLENED